MSNGDYDAINETSYIAIQQNIVELKSIITTTHDAYQINFGDKDFIGDLLGFPSVILMIGSSPSSQSNLQAVGQFFLILSIKTNIFFHRNVIFQ